MAIQRSRAEPWQYGFKFELSSQTFGGLVDTNSEQWFQLRLSWFYVIKAVFRKLIITKRVDLSELMQWLGEYMSKRIGIPRKVYLSKIRNAWSRVTVVHSECLGCLIIRSTVVTRDSPHEFNHCLYICLIWMITFQIHTNRLTFKFRSWPDPPCFVNSTNC